VTLTRCPGRRSASVMAGRNTDARDYPGSASREHRLNHRSPILVCGQRIGARGSRSIGRGVAYGWMMCRDRSSSLSSGSGSAAGCGVPNHQTWRATSAAATMRSTGCQGFYVNLAIGPDAKSRRTICLLPVSPHARGRQPP
jgi:hypothetical protein